MLVTSTEKSTPPIGVPNVETTPTAHAAASIDRLSVWSSSKASANSGSFITKIERMAVRCTIGPSRPIMYSAASAAVSPTTLAPSTRGVR